MIRVRHEIDPQWTTMSWWTSKTRCRASSQPSATKSAITLQWRTVTLVESSLNDDRHRMVTLLTVDRISERCWKMPSWTLIFKDETVFNQILFSRMAFCAKRIQTWNRKIDLRKPNHFTFHLMLHFSMNDKKSSRCCRLRNLSPVLCLFSYQNCSLCSPSAIKMGMWYSLNASNYWNETYQMTTKIYFSYCSFLFSWRDIFFGELYRIIDSEKYFELKVFWAFKFWWKWLKERRCFSVSIWS